MKSYFDFRRCFSSGERERRRSLDRERLFFDFLDLECDLEPDLERDLDRFLDFFSRERDRDRDRDRRLVKRRSSYGLTDLENPFSPFSFSSS